MDSRTGESRLRLHPESLVTGVAAIELCDRREALALAGGPVAFERVRLTGADAPTPDRLTVAQLLRWIEQKAREGDDAPARLVERATAPRGAFAGKALSGAEGRVRILGVCNVTPDSFSDGGDHADPDAAIAFARAMVAAGADMIDVGGESTRPGAAPVPEDEEIARIVPVIEALAADGATVSVDTRRASVMRAALAAGAAIVNDVTALTGDPEALEVVAGSGAGVILMHMQGEPQTMQVAPAYDDVVAEIYDHLAGRIDACLDAGISPERIVVDPGFGFGKLRVHNLALIDGLAAFQGLGCGLAVGLSRKSFVGVLSGQDDPKLRLAGSLTMALMAVERGAQILRVHDVAETRQALDTWQAAIGARE